MTRWFINSDDAYNWIERMMNKFDHYEIRSTMDGICVRVF